MSDSMIHPASRHSQLSASATLNLSPRPRAIYCQAAGTLTIEDEAGTALPYAMTAGQVLDLRAVKVTNIASGTFYAWW